MTAAIQLNPHVRDAKPSATLAINELSAELERQGRQIFKYGFGQSPFPVPAPVVEALRANAPCKDYLPVKGLAALRKAVAEYHQRTDKIDCSAEDVIVGPGSKELMFILQLAFHGEIVIPTPAWVSYAPQAQIVGRPIAWLHTQAQDGWRLSPAQLADLCAKDPKKPRLLILNYPGNPTGGTYSSAHLAEIADVARRHGVLILSDEIYGALHHQGQHVSIAQHYPEGTIVSGGLSKWCGAGGWRMGTCVFPRVLRPLLEAVAVVASETYTSASAPIQHAAVVAFGRNDSIERYLRNCRRILSAVGKAVAERLASAGIQVTPPEGGFYLFPDLGPAIKRGPVESSDVLCRRLLDEAGVATLPGSAFGRASEELTLRLAYVNFDGEQALAAVEKLGESAALSAEFLSAHCGNVLAAAERMGSWLKQQK